MEQLISYIIGMILGGLLFIHLVNTGKMDNICDWIDSIYDRMKNKK